MAMTPYRIDTLQPSDWERVRVIYAEGIATGNATFETDTPTWQAWDAAHLPVPRLVARDADVVCGWAALTPVSSRCVYAGVGEVSLYVAANARAQGVGHALLTALITAAEAAGIWTLQAGVFPENIASLNVCRRCGFRDVGRRERLGQLHGIWRDVLLLERRSAIVGRS